MTNVTDKFDWERNYHFIKKLHSFTNNTRCITNRVMRTFIANKINDNTERNNWFNMLMADAKPEYQHHRHYHLEMELQ